MAKKNQGIHQQHIAKKIVVIYHGNCPDGFGGAWAAWKKFGSRAAYIGVSPQAQPSGVLAGKEVYMIDTTCSLPITKKLMKENVRVTAIDHHVTVKKATQATFNYLYAEKNSAAVLSWKYFHPTKPVPKLLKYIEATDLWNFTMPHVREISAYLDSFEFDFKTWSTIVRDIENSVSRKKCIEKGAILLQYQQKIIQRVAQSAELVEFSGYRTLAVNSPIFNSEIGNELTKRTPPIGIVWRRKRGALKVSLRSDGSVNVAQLAEKFGGGGHHNSSGFLIKGVNIKFPWKLLKST